MKSQLPFEFIYKFYTSATLPEHIVFSQDDRMLAWVRRSGRHCSVHIYFISQKKHCKIDYPYDIKFNRFPILTFSENNQYLIVLDDTPRVSFYEIKGLSMSYKSCIMPTEKYFWNRHCKLYPASITAIGSKVYMAFVSPQTGAVSQIGCVSLPNVKTPAKPTVLLDLSGQCASIHICRFTMTSDGEKIFVLSQGSIADEYVLSQYNCSLKKWFSHHQLKISGMVVCCKLKKNNLVIRYMNRKLQAIGKKIINFFQEMEVNPDTGDILSSPIQNNSKNIIPNNVSHYYRDVINPYLKDQSIVPDYKNAVVKFEVDSNEFIYRLIVINYKKYPYVWQETTLVRFKQEKYTFRDCLAFSDVVVICSDY